MRHPDPTRDRASARPGTDGGRPPGDSARTKGARVLRGVAIALALLALLGGVFACGDADDGAGAGTDVLARVNGAEVTQRDVDDVRAETRLAGEDDDPAAALDEAVGRELVRQEAERRGLSVTDAAVEERLAAVEARLGGEEALAKALESAGMSAEQLRRGAAYGLLREALRDDRFGDLAISEASLRSFYRKYRDELFTEPASARLGSILVRTEPLAKKLVDRLRAGEPFDRLARQYSRDPESKANGGMLGWITEATLPETLREAVEGLDRRAVSDPVEGPGGWFVLKLYDRRPATLMAFPEVEDQLRAELDQRKRMRALDRWIAAERKRAEIEILGP